MNSSDKSFLMANDKDKKRAREITIRVNVD